MARVILALDAPSGAEALRLVDRLGPDADFSKVGLELFTREGPAIVRALRERGHEVFLDLKLHDIPATVAGAVRAAAALDVRFLTVHASGGRKMLHAAANAAHEEGGGLRLLAVTLLTSLSAADAAEAWGRATVRPADEALRLALAAREEGLQGVVASPLEARSLRAALGPEAAIVTPGIRPAGAERHDQARVATPGDAVAAGADYLVVGRSVTAHPHPERALAAILREVREGAARA